jgi:putative transposase
VLAPVARSDHPRPVNRAYRRAYDHRLRDLVCEERNPALLAQLGIPRSTAASWIRRGPRSIVTSELFGQDEQALRARVLKLERRVQLLLGTVRLLFAVVRLFGFRLDSQRVPSGETKSSILAAVERAKKRIPVTVALRVLGLSASRYHTWRQLGRACSLEDRSSCPRTVPGQLTRQEIAIVHDMATALSYRHMPIRALALHAQRIGRVFAAPATWARLIRERGWRRPRQRVYPAKPKDGIRATKPGELLHIDVTIIKLVDGTRAYLHAVIDNFSRRILAWKLAPSLEPGTTSRVISEAAEQLPELDGPATLYADSGVENVNGEVDDLLGLGKPWRVLAQVEVTFSNSLIEAFWRSLKSNWIYINHLDSFAALERLVAFYVSEYNTVLPHAAFHGQTPDEIYFGRGDHVPAQLAKARRLARDARLQSNRGLSCEECRTPATQNTASQPIPPKKEEAV